MINLLKMSALVFFVSLASRAEDTNLAPNALLRFEFPQGLATSATPTAQLPANYAAGKKYPIVVYLTAAAHPLELAGAAVGPRDFITVSLPLPPASLSPEAVGDPYRTMLEKLFLAVTNITTAGNAAGGFAQGADAVATLLASRNEFILQHFNTFFFVKGGSDGLATSLTSTNPFPKPVRALALRCDENDSSSDRQALDRLADGKNATNAVIGLNLSSVRLRGYDGREELSKYLSPIGPWLRGTEQPAGILVQAREELMKSFTSGSYTNADGHVLPYRLFIPPGYTPDKKYPLVLFLHGSGEAGNNDETQLVGGGPAALSHPLLQAQHPSFVLCPQIPFRAQWGFGLNNNWPPQALFGLLGQLQKEFNLDADRIYITGLSLGGFGTWDMIGRYPNLFAAAVPVSAAGDPTQVEKFKTLPIWALQGDADYAVAFAGLMPKNKGLIPGIVGDGDMIAALEKAGGHPKFTVFKGQGHGIWPLAYNEPGLYDWLFSQKRTHPSGGVPVTP
jgi:pimeloyl-ACP methyl ester carboxylesterase